MKYVELKVRWNDFSESNSKIEAIKLVRNTLGCGLKEAKDEVEACMNEWRVWRMTPHQFGLWSVKSYATYRFPFEVADVLLIEQADNVVDWTSMITRPDY